jgi:hypothetical protein
MKKLLSFTAALLALGAIAASVDAEVLKDLEFFRLMEVVEAQERGEVDESTIQALADTESAEEQGVTSDAH